MLTLLHPYKTLQFQIAKTFVPYKDAIRRYSERSNQSIEAITTEYLQEHPEVSIQNVALLKNAIELWKTASQTSDMVAPVLYHYSIHCFISFFNYTFFKWDPPHARSHGITISRWGKKLSDVEVGISQSKKSLFQRFVDTWILLGACLAFSPHLPIMETEEIKCMHAHAAHLAFSNDCNDTYHFDFIQLTSTTFVEQHGIEIVAITEASLFGLLLATVLLPRVISRRKKQE